METTDRTAAEQMARDEAAGAQPPRRELTTADVARGETDPRPQPGHEPGPGPRAENQAQALFSPEDARGFQSRWEAVQVGFVDEPRRAVEQADALVAETLKRQAEMFAAAREDLESQWDRGQDISTEDLRQALRRYRAFFDRLLKL